jgi:hypothetical protein
MTKLNDKCKCCGQWIRNSKGIRKKEVIKELCELMSWDSDWEWKIQNTSLNYDMLVEIVAKINKGG